MNYQELEARAAVMASYEGWDEVSPPPDWATLLNQAWADYSWDTECYVLSVTFATVVGQAEYDLSSVGTPARSGWKYLTDVLYNYAAASSGTPLDHGSELFERQSDPEWLRRPSGTPSRFLSANPDTLRLIPAPSTGSVTCLARGICTAAALSAVTDTPGLPATFHEGIALRAVWLHGKIYAQGDARQRLAGYLSEYQEYVKRARKWLAPMRMRRSERVVWDRPSRRLFL